MIHGIASATSKSTNNVYNSALVRALQQSIDAIWLSRPGTSATIGSKAATLLGSCATARFHGTLFLCQLEELGYSGIQNERKSGVFLSQRSGSSQILGPAQKQPRTG